MDGNEIIKQVGFDFDWDSKKVWALDVPVESMDIQELVWHFDYPFWDKEGTDDYNLTPRELMVNPEKEPTHWNMMQKADTSYPIDVMMNKGRWTILDGLHRLVKLSLSGEDSVRVRKISIEYIDRIKK